MLNLSFLLRPGSCGYFCLKYIIKEKIEFESYMSLFRIKKVLNDKGYYCTCIRINKLEDVEVPCLTLIKINKYNYHYVVLKKIKKNKIYFYDPLFILGRRNKTKYFANNWSGICLYYIKI